MFLQTQWIQMTPAGLDLVLQQQINAAPAASFDVTSKIALYKAGPSPSLGMVLSAFTLCDFFGYAPVVLASVLGPVNFPGGRGMYKSLNYTQTPGTSTTQSALGMLWLDTTGAILYGAEQFATTVPFNVPGDFLDYEFVLAFKSRLGGALNAGL